MYTLFNYLWSWYSPIRQPLEVIDETEKGNIYIVSDKDSEDNLKYKLGITSRIQEQLLKDYRRSRPNIKCHIFITDVNNYKIIERRLLNKLKENRIENFKGNPSEWIEGLQLDFLIQLVTEEIKEYNEIICQFEIINVESIKESKFNIFIRDYCEISKLIDHGSTCKELYEVYKSVSEGYNYPVQFFGKLILNKITDTLDIDKNSIKIGDHYKYIRTKLTL